MLTIGTRLPVNAYVRLVKYVLNTDKHETLELWGYRDGSMARLTEVVNVLTRWNYVQVIRIKTRSDPALKIVVKPTTDFKKNFDEFALQLQQRREERDRLRAEKDAEKATQEEESKDQSTAAETEAGATSAAATETTTEPVAAEAEEEQTKA